MFCKTVTKCNELEKEYSGIDLSECLGETSLYG